MDWLPIEIAPANEPVLIYDDGIYYVAVWVLDPYPHWKGRHWVEPKFWMRLPAPPDNDAKPIETEAEYQAGLAEIELLMNAEPGSADEQRLKEISAMVWAYQDQHDPL